MKEKALTIFLCAIGIVAIAYGMTNNNDLVFIMGLLFVIGGYLIIRRKLKEAFRSKS